MRLFVLFSVFVFSAGAGATENSKVLAVSDLCDISFKDNGPCVYNNIIVNVRADKVTDDEKRLKILDVVNNGKKHTLQIVSQPSMLEGDKGYISFADINFDGYPDIAVTTSFGLANLYLEYWVYEPHIHTYQYIGNYVKFELNFRLKTLSHIIKINAQRYEKNTYYWKDYKLVKQ